MADSILSLSGASSGPIASPKAAASISAARAGREVQQAVVGQLLSSIEQAGQAQAPGRSPDRVQISSEAYQRLAAEGR